MMLAAAAIDPLETPLPWFALLAGGIAAVLSWRVCKHVKRTQDRAAGCALSGLLGFLWVVTAMLIGDCRTPIRTGGWIHGPVFWIDCWQLRIIASLALGVICSLPAGSLIAFILFALIRHAEQSEKRKAILDQAAQSLSSSPTAPRLEQSDHIRNSSAETYREENRD
jgi:hypothetical protein